MSQINNGVSLPTIVQQTSFRLYDELWGMMQAHPMLARNLFKLENSGRNPLKSIHSVFFGPELNDLNDALGRSPLVSCFQNDFLHLPPNIRIFFLNSRNPAKMPKGL